jgi:hypothetical protein
MTQEQLLKQLQFCKWKWNGWGEDIFQQACLIALERYKSFKNVNQKLFRLLCKEAARNLRRHEKYEICFSQLQYQQENEDDRFDFENMIFDFENMIVDPRFDTDLIFDEIFDEIKKVKLKIKKKRSFIQLPLPLKYELKFA